MEVIYADDYDRKIERAIKLLQSIPQDEEIELSYSGGKDSDVILELAKMAGIPFRAIYKNTTIDPPGTIRHCKSKGVEILQPKRSFSQIIRAKGWPTRRARFCCSELKEYKVLNRAIQGVRRAESSARAKRYHEPEICRVYSKKERVKVYLPILDWTDSDVERFIKERNIQCHPLYYDEQGRFQVKRRLGCIGCPMSTNNREEFKKYPKLLQALLKSAQIFLDTHPNSGSKKNFLDAYHMFYHNFFCDSYEDYRIKTQKDLWGGQFDVYQAIRDYFKLK